MGPAGAQRLPRRPPPRCSRGDRRRRDRPRRRRRHRHRLHRLHHGARQGRRHTAERAARVRQPAARLREALAPPRRAAAGGPHQRPGRGTRRNLAAALRRAHLLRMGVRQGTAAAGGGPGNLRRDGPLGGGGRLDRLAAVRQLRPQRLHRRLQRHLPGRPLPVRGLPGRPEPGLQGLRQRPSWSTPSAGWATPPAISRPKPPPGPDCRKASPSQWATWTPTSRRPQRRPWSPGSWWPSWEPPPAT